MEKIKVEFIGTAFTPNFEDKINAFIKDKDVIDIKYQCFPDNKIMYHNALIIYREKEG